MTQQRLLRALNGVHSWPPPVWIMRQAGRYLPEYRQIREKHKRFFDLVLDPQAAVDVTLQPLKRFPRLDAAIIFSDILVLPWALGQNVTFQNGHTPFLDPISDVDQWPQKGWQKKLQPILDNISRVREKLPHDKSLIAFAGAPWTLLTYMLGKDKAPDIFRQQDLMDALYPRLTALVAEWLELQARAGADVLMVFESWADAIPLDHQFVASVKPIEHILSHIDQTVRSPCIIFPRKPSDIRPYLALPWQGIGLHSSEDMLAVADQTAPHKALMGNLDPDILRRGGGEMIQACKRLVKIMQPCSNPWIVNLGHGILPTTPVSHVEAFLDILPA